MRISDWSSDVCSSDLPMPADMNGNGDIFGGWVLSQMDIAGGVVAARRAQGRVVTVAVDAMTFHQPIKVGDIVSIYGSVIRVGRSSMAVQLETIVARRLDPTRSEEHTSELQSLMRISYAVFCLKK